MKISKNMIDYGTDTNQVNLGVIPLTEGYDTTPLLSREQSLPGIKTLAAVAASPASPESITSEMPGDQAVTHEQLVGFVDSIKDGYINEIESSLTEQEKTLAANTVYYVVDRVTGGTIGTIDTNVPTGSEPVVKQPAGAPVITKLPEGESGFVVTLPANSSMIILPDGSVGYITF